MQQVQVGILSQVTYRGQGDTGHNHRHVMKVRTRTSEKAENSRHVDGGMFTTVAILNEKSFDP